MTVTASASDRDLVGELVTAGSCYSAMHAAEESYEIRSRPHFALRVELAEGVWTVLDRRSGIFGSGDSPNEAIVDFNRAVREHRDVLEAQPDLSVDLRAQLDYLRDRLHS